LASEPRADFRKRKGINPVAEMAETTSDDNLSEPSFVAAGFLQGLWFGRLSPDYAGSILKEVLEDRTGHYGELSPKCAETYFYYAQMLFDHAVARTDRLDEDEQRSSPAPDDAADAADAPGAPGASEEGEEGAESGAEEEDEEDEEEGGHAYDNDAEEYEDEEEWEEEEEEGDAHNNDDGDGDGDEDEDEDEEYEEGEDGRRDDEQYAPIAADLNLAWEMLDIARVILEKPAVEVEKAGDGKAADEAAGKAADEATTAAPPPPPPPPPLPGAAVALTGVRRLSLLADVHALLGDLACELEDYDAAAAEYAEAAARLAALRADDDAEPPPPPDDDDDLVSASERVQRLMRLYEAHSKRGAALALLGRRVGAARSYDAALEAVREACRQSHAVSARGLELSLRGPPDPKKREARRLAEAAAAEREERRGGLGLGSRDMRARLEAKRTGAPRPSWLPVLPKYVQVCSGN